MRGFCSVALPHTYNLNISPFSTEIDLQYDDHRHWSQNVWMVMVSENNPVRGEEREAIISFGGNNQRYIYLISSNFLELLFSALWTNLNQKDAMYIGDTPNAKNLKTQFGVFINIKILNIVVPDLPNIFWALFWFKMDHCAIPMISVVDIE